MDVIRTDPTRRAARHSRRRRAHRGHPRYAALTTAALALGLAAPAGAPAQLPPNNGGVDQYVAPVPDSRGDRPANPRHEGGGGGGGGNSSQLPAQVRSSLPAGSEGAVLARLATDPGSGAPSGGGDGNGDRDRSAGGGVASGGSGGGGSGDGSGSAPATHEKDVSAASAITSAVSDDPGVAVVVAAIVAMTLALGAIGLARRRRSPPSS
jgi:hypothetical protein